MTKPQDGKDTKEKLRVYEYAKSLNMSSKEIITILKRLDTPVNNHMSVMENDMVNKVEGFFRDIKANAAAKRAQGNPQVSASAPSKRPADKRPEQQGVHTIQRQEQSTNQNQQERQVTMNTTSNTQGSGSSAGTQQRPASQGQGGGQGRGPGQGRPQGQGGQGRPPGQGGGQGRPQGQGGQGRPPGQGGGQGRPQGQGGGQGRPPGQGGQGRPQGQGGQGRPPGQGGGYGGSRPQGAGQAASATGPRGESRSTAAAPRTFTDNKPAGGTRDFSRGGSAGGAGRTGGPGGNNNNRRGGGKPGQGAGGRFDDRGGSYKSRGRGGKGGRGQQPQREKIDNTPKKIIVRGSMTVGDLAKLLHKDASEVIKKLIFLGVMATINQELDIETIQLVASEFKVEEVEIKIPVEEDDFETVEEKDEEENLIARAPVVTIMGHVDHGKTTLLDAIRSTNVTGGEAGGITQHIGAYQVEINNKKITFLDTPGHAAFTMMRARGAEVTDITIIVVAADDGVMPQTVEAINHAKAANVPIIVAVNKIDKPDANPDTIKQELTKYELVPEEWGGDTIFVNISAKQRINLEELLEMILLVAEVNDYKANPNKRARGTVLEAELDKGKGPVARVLVQHGTLKIGDAFVAGNTFGRVRAMINDKGRRLKEADPSTPVEITGLTEVPQAGDPFMVFEDERKARDIAERRSIKQRQSEMGANSRVTLDDLYKHITEGEIKDLNVIIKADVQGSLEALRGSLEKIEVEGVRVKSIHNGVGAITESDITLASASNAIVIGFNVRPETQAAVAAEQEKVDVRLHNIIYNVIEEIEQAMKGMLDPVFKEVVIGHAEVRNLFKVSKVGTIAGCMVIDGKISRSAEARIVRSGIVVYQGKIDTLKRFKDDVKDVAQGYECGITVERFNDLQEGDVIEAFVQEKVER
ncbi:MULTISPECIES: translation initiation factor IF-2 [unclassified Paenibacillus]|uniref:translation initiation factor IF-2 n=1 Tax=unclassified Paenibacillus TaxID=185978 RepID=UPI00095699F6|nr:MULTISPECIES: translation initiation factor IF-2 [unclassified Paenibacillus]ASS65674.1 translation initiation factor IF-2 [Paenibacillus sp. RUD330]SIQ27623.1 translation initiation factor IF-2 [Paenibacillus sp. RU4X]SIQ49929.1 translation initiation factor IF-2 [Paenibacillus sp. RU4T]